MRTSRRPILALAALAALVVSACGSAPSEPAEPEPATVEAIDGSALKQVTLSDEAVERVGIETSPVTSASGGRLMVPSSTVLYDPDGQAWVFTNPEGHVYLRAQVTVYGTDGDATLLTAGPPADTQVVTVGVAELYGTELGVGDPE